MGPVERLGEAMPRQVKVVLPASSGENWCSEKLQLNLKIAKRDAT